MKFGNNKTRKQNYEQNVVLDLTLRNVKIVVDIKADDTVTLKVIYNYKEIAEFGIWKNYLWSTNQYYWILRELETFLIDFAYKANPRRIIKEYIKDFEIPKLEVNKEDPNYDIIVCEYIEGKFKEFIKQKIKLFLEFRNN